eukprot:CAMPEP_0194217262 /NCGR_PEP_ID=MMETSP0156-20130528/20800_1 /TAXON_ID=33649 /ORGANISM="Thalassionema nitzschioides, Strain L26-B" /LENGTH=78 /DNA_ID=CAMNT_0038946255 /DNA_START=229 /DNA_END=461 /DNA_ORIENTATION=-
MAYNEYNIESLEFDTVSVKGVTAETTKAVNANMDAVIFTYLEVCLESSLRCNSYSVRKEQNVGATELRTEMARAAIPG